MDSLGQGQMFVIEDEAHAEWYGQYKSIAEAMEELQKLSTIPWDQEPNKAPCTNWKNCGRKYELNEYDSSTLPWKEVRRISALHINASGVEWSPNSHGT
jgi:hypothetical protein